jgi:enoyl-CoA hydratase/carnithine racemase
MVLAERILANAPLAVRESRRIALASVDAPDDVGWKMSFEGMAAIAGSEDFAEGPRAFIEKRPPEWKGR